MFKILKKIKFNEKENRMTNIAATEDVIKNYKVNYFLFFFRNHL